MIKLITDTACLYSPSQAEKLGFVVNPLTITVNNHSYQEFVDIQAVDLYKEIADGHLPSSSQPPIGMILESIEANKEDEIILLCMADGLSGTYNTALSAASQFENANIHVINSKTLCGPQKYMVEQILKMIKENNTIDEILAMINKKIESVESFLLPNDFDYLKRGGRCTPLAAALGGLLKLQPVVMQTPDGKRLDRFVTGRSFPLAIKKIISHYENKLDNKILYISHAHALEKAIQVKEMFENKFNNLEIIILELSCAFITQGGTGCIAIQSIAK